MSIATRLNTDVPIAVCPAGVLASWKNVVGSSFLAWKTTSELVDTLGGIARDNTSRDTVEVAVEEALISF